MSYGGYNQGGYGQPNPYAQQGANPYAQQQTGGYGGGGYGGGGYEMQNINGGGYGQDQPMGNDPNRILNDCKDINRSIDQIDRDVQGIASIQAAITSVDNNGKQDAALYKQLEEGSDNIVAAYQALIPRVRKLKGLPDSASPRNAPQVGLVDRRLRDVHQKYRKQESVFQSTVKEQVAHQVRIVNPNATTAEINAAVEDPSQPIFAQALQNSNRRGQAQTVLSNVTARHDAIQKIERDMITLAQLFQDLQTAVIEQEPLVETIEQKGEEVHDNVQKANVEIDGAITKARSRNRKKWICLGISVVLVIIAIIVIIVVLKNAGVIGGSSGGN